MQTLSPKEKSLAYDFLRNVLETDTQNPPGNEANLASFFANQFSTAGIESRVINEAKGRANVIAYLGSRNLDSANRCLCFNGHLDTVPVGELSAWSYDPFCVHSESRGEDTVIIARGASDMKGGLAAQAQALLLAKERGMCLRDDILFLGSYDEESGGSGATAFSESFDLGRINQMIIGEPTNLQSSIASKGALWIAFEIMGKTSHAAYAAEGDNALEQAYALYLQIKAEVECDADELLGTSSCTLVKLEGGVKTNMVPDRANMILDIRLCPHRSQQNFLAWLASLSNKCGTEICFEMNVINQRVPVKLDTTSPLLYRVTKARRQLSAVRGESKLLGTRFFSDASIFKRYAPDLDILVLGPGNPAFAHRPDEELYLSQYFRAIELYISIMETT